MALWLRMTRKVHRIMRRFRFACFKRSQWFSTGDNALQCHPSSPLGSPELLEWYQNELKIFQPSLQGSLLDLSLMKSRLQFYRQLGVSSIEFAELITQSPQIMDFEHSPASRENLQFLLSEGLSSYLLCNVLIKMPSVLTLSLEAHLKPRIAYYKERLSLSSNEMLKIYEECPEFLQHSIVKDIRFRVAFFQKMGFPLDELKSLVLLPCPQILGSTYYGDILPRLNYLRSVSSSFCVKESLSRFPHLMHLPLDAQLKPIVLYFQQELNMSRRLFSQMLQIYPRVLAANVDRDIRPKVEYLRGLGLDQLQTFKILVHRPQIVSKSLKEGLIKRIEELTSMGVPIEFVTSLIVRSPKYFS